MSTSHDTIHGGPSAQAGSPEHIPEGFHPDLESLRGIAAVLVAIFHVINLHYAKGTMYVRLRPPMDGSPSAIFEWILRVLADGHGAVVFFFVLSGFVLRLSLGRMRAGSGMLSLKFLGMRLFRLYPAIAVALALYILFFWATGLTHSPHGAKSFHAGAILRNYLLLETTIIGPLWSLQIELLAAPLILFAFLLERRLGWIALVILGIIFGALTFTYKFCFFLFPSIPTIAPMYSFLIGMGTASLGHYFKGRIGSKMAVVLLVFYLSAFFISGVTIGSLYKFGLLVTSLASAGLIGVFVYGPPMTAQAWLRRRGTRFLGRISYSFYLLHAMLVFVVGANAAHFRPLIAKGIPASVVGAVLAAAVVGLTIPIAVLLHRWVEIPGLAAGQRAFARFSQRRLV